MNKKFFLTLAGVCLLLACHASSGINENKKRAEEIKQLQWRSGDKNFAERTIPDKWKNESAVIIAKSNKLSYKKEVLVSSLSHDSYDHYRVMLLDNSAIERYAQFTIPGSGSYGGTRTDMYAGFKIFKPDGTEIEIPLSEAVLQKQELNNRGFDMYKLAIPNLQVGDILDYYICEESTVMLNAKYHSFDPVILQLHDDYPIMKQKFSFEILRKCYLNLKSLNGAPQFKLTEDAEKERSYYSLEDADRESVKDIMWLYPYRELPILKFKIVYASSFVANAIPGFIGEPGVIKSSISTEEIKNLFAYIFVDQTIYGAMLRSEMNKRYKTLTDKDKLARQAYYVMRNKFRVDYAEGWLISDASPNPDKGFLDYLVGLSSYFRYKKISHEILIGIPRQISSLDDLILENEITIMMKVNTPKPFYIGRLDNNSIPGEIDTDMQGITVYTANAISLPRTWSLRKATVPITPHEENKSEAKYELKITDLNEGKIEAHVTKSSSGVQRIFPQNMLMDIYDYQEEENVNVIPDTGRKSKKEEQKFVKLRENYQSSREDRRIKNLKTIVKGDLDFEFEDPHDLKILQAGRFEKTPEFKYSHITTFKGAIKRAGPNYLVDIGKFIEGQAFIKNEDKERKYNVYRLSSAAFNITVALDIPEGYTIQGIEKLNTRVENATGGFTSIARIENNKLIIETKKHYKSNFEKKESWLLMVSFLDAAHEFTQKQVLLEKIR
jgi:hypothetical protein